MGQGYVIGPGVNAVLAAQRRIELDVVLRVRWWHRHCRWIGQQLIAALL